MTNLDTLFKESKKTYNKALKRIKTLPNYDPTHHKTLAGCVTMLCHDDPRVPMQERARYLAKLMQLSNEGPTVREHYCMSKAFSLNDGMETGVLIDGMRSYEPDPRGKLPGTWDFETAFQFCVTHVYAPIDDHHKYLYKVEECFDDCPADLELLKRA